MTTSLLILLAILSVIFGRSVIKRLNRVNSDGQPLPPPRGTRLVWKPLAGIFIILTLSTFVYVSYLAISYETVNIIETKITQKQVKDMNTMKDIDNIVLTYLEYNKEKYENTKFRDSLASAAVIPDLQKNDRLQEHIQTHKDNLKEVEKLKNQKIESARVRWLLYFDLM